MSHFILYFFLLLLVLLERDRELVYNYIIIYFLYSFAAVFLLDDGFWKFVVVEGVIMIGCKNNSWKRFKQLSNPRKSLRARICLVAGIATFILWAVLVVLVVVITTTRLKKDGGTILANFAAGIYLFTNYLIFFFLYL